MAESAKKFRDYLKGDGVTTGEVFWSAVFAGAMVALIGQFLLTLLGAGLGAASFDYSGGDRLSGETAAWGAFIWWMVASLAASFAGGWTAGWVSGAHPRVDRLEGGFQGFLSWAVATLFIAALVLGLMGRTASAFRLGGPLVADTEAAAILDARALTPAEAEEAKDAVAAGALWSFFALILGGASAIAGGVLGAGHAKRMIADNIRRQAPIASRSTMTPQSGRDTSGATGA